MLSWTDAPLTSWSTVSTLLFLCRFFYRKPPWGTWGPESYSTRPSPAVASNNPCPAGAALAHAGPAACDADSSAVISKPRGGALAATAPERADSRAEALSVPMPHVGTSARGDGTWVVRWVDYTSKYGLGYLLSDGSVGVVFNDQSRIVLPRARTHLCYWERKPSGSTVDPPGRVMAVDGPPVRGWAPCCRGPLARR